MSDTQQQLEGAQSLVSAQLEAYQQQLATLQAAQAPTTDNVAPVSGNNAVQQAQALHQTAVANPAQYGMSRIMDPDLHYPGQSVKEGLTVFLYGGLGTRKTTWAGLWPKPLFLSIGPEGGDDSLAMLPSLYGIPTPPVFRIRSVSHMVEKIDQISKHYIEWDINTVVVDSTTYYLDMWTYDLLKQRYPGMSLSKLEEAGMAAAMVQRDWGLLATHTKDIAMKLHGTKLNVIWIALEKPEKISSPNGETRVVALNPFIRGEASVKIPGLCKMIIHAMRVMKPNPMNPMTMITSPVFYTAPTPLTKDYVRHKFGNAFPEGVLTDSQYGDMPTFRAIYERIGNFVYMT